MLILTIVVGFAMMTLGVALLLLGEVPFVGGKRIPAVRARLIGGVLVSFLPLAWALKTLCDLMFGLHVIQGPVVTALTFSVCCLVTFVILFRVVVPKRAPRPPAPTAAGVAKKNPFGETEQAAPDETSPWTEPEPAKKSRKPAADKDPFDFN